MSVQPFSSGDYNYSIVGHTVTTTGTNIVWDPQIANPAFNIKVWGINKLDFDLSRFSLIGRLRFLFNLMFKGKAIVEVDSKIVKMEKVFERFEASK